MTNGDKIRAMTDEELAKYIMEELAKFIMDVTDRCPDGWKCGDFSMNDVVGSCSEKEFAIYFGLEAEENDKR